MEEYKVLKGEVHENGATYKVGDTFFTTSYRAVQLGLNDGKIELVKKADPETEPDYKAKFAEAQNIFNKINIENSTLKAQVTEKDNKIQILTDDCSAKENLLQKTEKTLIDTESKLNNALDENKELNDLLKTKDAEISELKSQIQNLSTQTADKTAETKAAPETKQDTKKKN
jgi:chromosome segregation ATPase